MIAYFALVALIVIVVAVGMVLGRGVERMPQELKVLFGTVGLCIMAMYGAYWLIQWYTTGTLWVNFRNAGGPNNYQLITFDDYPGSAKCRVDIQSSNDRFAECGSLVRPSSVLGECAVD